METMVIQPEDVLEALLSGFEVLMIDKRSRTKFGPMCKRLTDSTFNGINQVVAEANSNIIFVKTRMEDETV